jgi:hypothetical protein
MTLEPRNEDTPSKRDEFNFERQKSDREFALKQFDSWKSPVLIAVAGGIITLFSNVITNYVSANGAQELENRKFQAKLIMKFLEPASAQTRLNNLEFLKKSGLIPNFDVKFSDLDALPQVVSDAAANSTVNPSYFGEDNRIGGRSLEFMLNAYRSLVRVEISYDKIPSVCTGFHVAPDKIVTAQSCISEEMKPGSSDLGIVAVKRDGKPVGTVSSVTFYGKKDIAKGLAVLEVADSPAVPSLTFSKLPPQIGDRMFFLFSNTTENSFGISADSECRIYEVTPDEVTDRCDAGAGSDGAPIISMETGEIVAVHTSGDKDKRKATRVGTLGVLP